MKNIYNTCQLTEKQFGFYRHETTDTQSAIKKEITFKRQYKGMFIYLNSSEFKPSRFENKLMGSLYKYINKVCYIEVYVSRQSLLILD